MAGHNKDGNDAPAKRKGDDDGDEGSSWKEASAKKTAVVEKLDDDDEGEKGSNNKGNGKDGNDKAASSDQEGADNNNNNNAADDEDEQATYKTADEEDHNDDEEDNNGHDNEDGKGPKGKKKGPKSITRIRYSNDFKVKVLDELEVTNVTVAEMARRHKLPEATLRDWVKTKDKICTAQVNRRGSAKSNSRDNLQKVTDALRTFMDLNDRLGACGMSKLPITNAMIAKQGQEVKAILLEKDEKKPYLTAQERKTLHAFNASIWWSKKWARKHNLHSVGHREAAKAAAALSSQVPEIRKEYSRDHVFFVVDTMLFYKVLPTRSYVVEPQEKGSVSGAAPTVAGGEKKKKKYLETLQDRLSLFICSNSSGTHKIPLTMISDAKDPPSFVANRQKLCPYLHQENAWANPKSLLSWWKDIFLPNIREWTDEKVLLVLQKPSIVDLDDPQEQVSVKFLPPLLANNHNNTADGLSVSSFFEPPINMLSVVKTKYRYELLKEVLQIYEEREPRRDVAAKAELATPGLKQGHLPHLQDCMRILNTVWTELPPSAISSSEEEGGGKKKKRRKRRKKKGTTDNDIIDNDSSVFSDELGTEELIKQIVHFFRKNNDDVGAGAANDADVNPLDMAVAEVKSCFLNDKMLLKSNQENQSQDIADILQNWIGLEDAQDIRAMLQTEILSGMKFRLIIGVDDVDTEEDEANATSADGGGKPAAKDSIDNKPVNDNVALDCATQLLECAVRLSKENSAFHDLASKLIEASDSAFVALREAKLPPEERQCNKKEAPPPKKRKPRTVSSPRKKRAKIAAKDKADNGETVEKEKTATNTENTLMDAEEEAKGNTNPEAAGVAAAAAARGAEYAGAVFEI